MKWSGVLREEAKRNSEALRNRTIHNEPVTNPL